MDSPLYPAVRDAQVGVEFAPGQKADPHLMRQLNYLAVLKCIRTQGPLARVTIADFTHLSRTAVSSIVPLLRKADLVREGELARASSKGGRKPIPIEFHAAAGHVLGIDLGRTHLVLILTDLNATVLESSYQSFALTDGPETVFAYIAQKIRALVQLRGIPLDPEHILGIGLALPGPWDARRQVLIDPPRMSGWSGVPIRDLFQRYLGVQNIPLHVGNDANLGALGIINRLGPWRDHIKPGVQNLAYVKLGTGIGCGLILDGKLYGGSHGAAGEFGHTPAQDDGPECDCRHFGCLESIAGADAIIATAARLRTEAHVPRARLSGAETSPLDTLIRAAQQGDAASRTALALAGKQIGMALAGLINLLNPEVVVLGGQIAKAEKYLVRPLRQQLDERCILAVHDYALVLAPPRDRAVALGGVAAVLTYELERFALKKVGAIAGEL